MQSLFVLLPICAIILFFINNTAGVVGINGTIFDPCKNNTCLHDSKCIHDISNEEGYRCVCRDYYDGQFCEKKLPSLISIVEPEDKFSVLRFWSHKVSRSRDENSLWLTDLVSFQIKTVRGNGLLFQARDSNSNYLRIVLVNYDVVIAYLIQNTIFKTDTNCKLFASTDVWHQIRITNNFVYCNNISYELPYPRKPSENSRYVSSVTVHVGNVPPNAFYDSELKVEQWYGCLRNLTIGSRVIPLVLNSSNVGVVAGCDKGCYGERGSYWATCSATGQCQERWNRSYTCSCWDSLYIGPNCKTDVGHPMSDESNRYVVSSAGHNHPILRLKFAFKIRNSENIRSQRKVLFFAKGIPLSRFEVFINVDNSLVVNYSMPYRDDPVVIKFEEVYIYKNTFFGVLIHFLDVESVSVNDIVVNVKLLNSEGMIIAEKSAPENKANCKKFHISKFFIGGKEKLKRPYEGNFDGCIHNFAIEFMDIILSKPYNIDWYEHDKQFKFSRPVKSAETCLLTFPEPPPTTSTVRPTTTILTTSRSFNLTNLTEFVSQSKVLDNQTYSPFPSLRISFAILIVIIIFGILMIILSAILLVCVIRFCHRSTTSNKKPANDKFLDFTNTTAGYEKFPVNNTTVLSDIDDRSSLVSANSSLTSPIPFKPAYKAMSILRSERSYLAQPDPENDLDSEEQKETTFNNNLSRPESMRQQRSASDYRITSRARLYPAYRDSGYAGSFKSAQPINSHLLVPQAQILACRLSALTSPRVSMTTLPRVSRTHPITTL